MKITNRTHWRTDQMRQILQRCLEMELEPARRRGLKVVISYRRRGGGSSGCAFIGGRWCKIRVSSDIFDSRDFAVVACHEFAHIRGMEHRDMPHYYIRPHMRKQGNDNIHSRYDWARSLVVEREATQEKPAQAEIIGDKHQAAIARLSLAVTRAKRANTILKKWQRKVRYYEKRMAAMKGQS